MLRPRGKLTENRVFGDKWLVETTGPKARKGDGQKLGCGRQNSNLKSSAFSQLWTLTTNRGCP